MISKGFFSPFSLLFLSIKFFYSEPIILITSHFYSKAEYEIILVLQLQSIHTDKDEMQTKVKTNMREGDIWGGNFCPY